MLTMLRAFLEVVRYLPSLSYLARRRQYKRQPFRASTSKIRPKDADVQDAACRHGLLSPSRSDTGDNILRADRSRRFFRLA